MRVGEPVRHITVIPEAPSYVIARLDAGLCEPLYDLQYMLFDAVEEVAHASG